MFCCWRACLKLTPLRCCTAEDGAARTGAEGWKDLQGCVRDSGQGCQGGGAQGAHREDHWLVSQHLMRCVSGYQSTLEQRQMESEAPERLSLALNTELECYTACAPGVPEGIGIPSYTGICAALVGRAC